MASASDGVGSGDQRWLGAAGEVGAKVVCRAVPGSGPEDWPGRGWLDLGIAGSGAAAEGRLGRGIAGEVGAGPGCPG